MSKRKLNDRTEALAGMAPSGELASLNQSAKCDFRTGTPRFAPTALPSFRPGRTARCRLCGNALAWPGEILEVASPTETREAAAQKARDGLTAAAHRLAPARPRMAKKERQ